MSSDDGHPKGVNVPTDAHPHIRRQARGALFEIIERLDGPEAVQAVEDHGIIRPNEIRVNGVPILCPADEPVQIHEMTLGRPYGYADSDDSLLRVTLTCWARRVVMGAHDVSREVDVETLRREIGPSSGVDTTQDALLAALDHLPQQGLDAVAAALGIER